MRLRSLVWKILPHEICRVESASMTTREKAHALLDELPDAELDEIVKQLEVRHEEQSEPEMAALPEAWKTFEDGTPVPNWVAALHEAREGS
jgi:hypothetical protein